jgi:hypothetical protein
MEMFLRSTKRRKDGKDLLYFSVVENRRVSGGKTVQRTVLYLGKTNDRQHGERRWKCSMNLVAANANCKDKLVCQRDRYKDRKVLRLGQHEAVDICTFLDTSAATVSHQQFQHAIPMVCLGKARRRPRRRLSLPLSSFLLELGCSLSWSRCSKPQ